MATSREQLKAYFETGDIPTEAQFEELIDSLSHKLDPEILSIITQVNIEGDSVVFRDVNSNELTSFSIDDIGSELLLDGNFMGEMDYRYGDEPDTYGTERRGILKFRHTPSSTTDIFHIKTPLKIDADYKMYRFSAEGYFYGSGEIIDVTWVGYCYPSYSDIIKTRTSVLRAEPDRVQAGQYVGSDNHVYLWLKSVTSYYTTFRINTMRVGNGVLYEEGDLEVIVSDQVQL